MNPILGLSHLFAVIGVGLWGGMLGGRGPWLLPACFVVGMGMGYVAGLDGMFLVHASILLWTTLVALAAAVLFRVTLPVSEAAGTVGFFGLIHGIVQGGAAGLAGV